MTHSPLGQRRRAGEHGGLVLPGGADCLVDVGVDLTVDLFKEISLRRGESTFILATERRSQTRTLPACVPPVIDSMAICFEPSLAWWTGQRKFSETFTACQNGRGDQQFAWTTLRSPMPRAA